MRSLSLATLSVNSSQSNGSQQPGSTPRTSVEACVSVAMTLSGCLVAYFGGTLYRLSPARSHTGAPRLLSDLWMTYCLTLGAFLVCAAGSTLSIANLRALYQRLTPLFVSVLLIPSAMDLIIAGASTLALAFAQPALVGTVKAAVQLLSLRAVARLLLRHKITSSQWLCLVVMTIAVAALCVNAVLVRAPPATPTDASDQLIGVLLATLAGIVGAWRNLAEAALLQDAGLPSGALLLAESLLSSCLLGGVGGVAILVAYTTPSLSRMGHESLRNMNRTMAQTAAPWLLAGYLLAGFGKDAGKFWLIKYCSALRQKVLALLFPFGTWAVGLATFYGGGSHHKPPFGEPWHALRSPIELAAFVVILVANVFVLLLTSSSRQVPCPVVERCCASVDRVC